MRRRTRWLEHSLHPVKLHLDDVREIVRVVDEAIDDPQVVIKTSNYELSSVEELTNLNKGELPELGISYGKPTCGSVSIAPSYVHLFAWEDTAVHRGIHAQIHELLRSRQRGWTWTYNPRFWLAVGGLTTVLAGLLAWAGAISQIPVLLFFALGVLAVYWLFLLVAIARRPFEKSVIVLKERNEEQSFWQRNKDQLVVQVLGGLILLAVGVVLGLLFQSITGVNPLRSVP